MARGTVKWFDPKKGFGFVVNEDGVDVFVHYSNIAGEGFRCLKNGQAVEYRPKKTEKGLLGLHVEIVAAPADHVVSDDEQAIENSHLNTG